MVVRATHALSCGGARSEAGGALLLILSFTALNGVLLGTRIAWWHFHAYLPSLVLLTLQCSTGATLSRHRKVLRHVQFELGNRREHRITPLRKYSHSPHKHSHRNPHHIIPREIVSHRTWTAMQTHDGSPPRPFPFLPPPLCSTLFLSSLDLLLISTSPRALPLSSLNQLLRNMFSCMALYYLTNLLSSLLTAPLSSSILVVAIVHCPF